MHKSPWILKMQLATKRSCTNNEAACDPSGLPKFALQLQNMSAELAAK